ncbi:uncharacterized protein FOMMEDRAFT_153349 [Fomitiporia mediterranea MF3/22]|uniref:uncharacterized protein n=1 Tax=Fomitiporia mediterranea (strain MF3/22) TaxID=694068 RepID=UPI0004408E90|nr:uncharacterized protein FOMMEDRAFT_153349 [Fomitiporia mediterranea MF3/22]EJD05998.1 hypothetical protein FOMMEDRAFT_153349 [Fomitiporia mediterranea MF3/22]
MEADCRECITLLPKDLIHTTLFFLKVRPHPYMKYSFHIGTVKVVPTGRTLGESWGLSQQRPRFDSIFICSPNSSTLFLRLSPLRNKFGSLMTIFSSHELPAYRLPPMSWPGNFCYGPAECTGAVLSYHRPIYKSILQVAWSL